MTAADASFLQYKWNNAKRLTTVTNNAGETIEYGYNANGDVTSSVVKSALRKAAARTVTKLWREIAKTLKTFTPQECAAYLKNCGYAN